MNGPRIRGKVGQATEPPEYAGKWFFTIWMNEFGAGEPTDADSLGQFGPWDSEEIAHKELKNAVQLCCDQITTLVDDKPSGEYIDLKTNVRRKWDRSNEN